MLALVGLVAVAEIGYAGDEQLRAALLILGAQVLVAPFVGVARAHFQGVQRGQLIAVGDVALAVGMLAATAVCVAADLGFAAIAAATASRLRRAGAGDDGAAAARRAARLGASRRTVARRLLRISLPLGATLVINYLYFRLDVAAAVDPARHRGGRGLRPRLPRPRRA